MIHIPKTFKVVTEDIDGVLFPIAKQYAKFLQRKYYNNFPHEIITEFLNSNHDYFDMFIKHIEDEKKKKAYIDLIQEVLPIIPGYSFRKETIGNNDPLESEPVRLFGSLTYREFSNEREFLHGINSTIQEMNKKIYRHLNGLPVAISARGTMNEPDKYYDKCIIKTKKWSIENNAYLDDIFYYEEGTKHAVVDDLDYKYGEENYTLVCHLDDTLNSAQGFIELGIPVIVFNLESTKEQKFRADMIRKQYAKTDTQGRELLTIVTSVEDARDKVLSYVIGDNDN